MDSALTIALIGIGVSLLGVQLALLSHVVRMAAWSGGISVRVKTNEEEVEQLRDFKSEQIEATNKLNTRLTVVEQR